MSGASAPHRVQAYVKAQLARLKAA